MKSPYTDSLAHTTWECKYHIVFAPKFRRKEIYGKLKKEIGMILRELCRRKEVEIINAEACPDHIHMYVSIEMPLKERLKAGAARPYTYVCKHSAKDEYIIIYGVFERKKYSYNI